MRAHYGIAISLVAAGAGCSLTSLSGLSGGDEGSADAALESAPPPDGAAAADASQDRSASDAGDGAVALPNLVTNGDFEDPNGSYCGPPWSGYQSTGSRTPDAHSGTTACNVCGAGGQTSYTIDGFELPGVKAGERYTASAWVRATSAVPSPGKFVLYIRLYNGQTVVEQSASANVALATSWQRFEVTHDATVTPDRLNVYGAVGGGAPGSCFTVDDIALVRQ